MTITCRFADVNVRITAFHANVCSLCSDYETAEPPDFAVTTSQAYIDRERARADHPGYSEAYLERKGFP